MPRSSTGLLAALAVALLGAAATPPGGAAAQTLTNIPYLETRGITEAVGSRALDPGRPGGTGLSLWFTTSYSHVDLRSQAYDTVARTPHTRTDLYQVLIGGDVRRGRFLFGVAAAASFAPGRWSGAESASNGVYGSARFLTRSTTTETVGPTHYDQEAWSIAPYAAFAVTDAVLVSGTVGYTHDQTRVRTGAEFFTLRTEYLGPGYSALGYPRATTWTSAYPGSRYSVDTNTAFADLAANLTLPVRDTGLTLGGRLGYRYAHGWYQGEGYRSEGFGLGTAYLGAGASYQLGRFRPFARVQWEYSNPTTPYSSTNGKLMRDAVFLVGGLDMQVTEKLVAGLQAMTQQGNPDLANNQVALSLRYTF